jgi:hypothetical protein
MLQVKDDNYNVVLLLNQRNLLIHHPFEHDVFVLHNNMMNDLLLMRNIDLDELENPKKTWKSILNHYPINVTGRPISFLFINFASFFSKHQSFILMYYLDQYLIINQLYD